MCCQKGYLGAVISNAWIFLSVFAVSVHLSHPQRSTETTRVLNALTLTECFDGVVLPFSCDVRVINNINK